MSRSKMKAGPSKRVSVLDCLHGKAEEDAVAALKRDYEVTDLDAVNLVALARLGQNEVLKLALSRLKPRET